MAATSRNFSTIVDELEIEVLQALDELGDSPTAKTLKAAWEAFSAAAMSDTTVTFPLGETTLPGPIIFGSAITVR